MGSWIIVLTFVFIVEYSWSGLLEDQYEALYSLYTETGGENWDYNSFEETHGKEWDFSGDEDPCADRWKGVYCNSSYVDCELSPCELSGLILNKMGMIGSLPDGICSLGASITALSLSENTLYSTLPSCLGDYTNLVILSLSANAFTGPIPPSYGQFKELKVFDIMTNMLTNQIPAEVMNAPFEKMKVFYIGENLLSGPLPLLSGAFEIEQIYLTKNAFSGAIPHSYYTFSNLFYLGIATNDISGTLSADIGNLKSLRNFYAGYNAIESTIPDTVGNLRLLEYFEMTRNGLYGTIPSTMGALTRLLVLELNVNDLTGVLPNELGNLDAMHTLYLHENAIQGTIPDSYSRMSSLQLCILGLNGLTGTIPTSLGTLSQLYDFSVYNNKLTGQIPGSFFLISRLENLLVQNNKFTGFLLDDITKNGLENEDIAVMHLDISNNRFHGSVPGNLFSRLNRILSVAATKNCFSGSLPESICEAQSLEVLALDGLASGDNCREQMPYPFSLLDAYLISPLVGSIPPCYWNLPNLTVLHLSGNGLGGSIISDIPDGNLQNISLSFNRLTGTIPKYLMEHHFVELRLSNNKFRGMFDTPSPIDPIGVANRSILDLSTNRLSGFVPRHICDVADLSALEGNLFDCDHHHSLPYNDPQYKEYVCASRQLKQPILFCIGVIGVALIGVLYALMLHPQSTSPHNQYNDVPSMGCHQRLGDYIRNVIVWASLEELNSCGDGRIKTIYAPNLTLFVSFIRMIRKTFFLLSAVVVIFCIPLYYCIKHSFSEYYSTHEKQYTWTVSIAYMSGIGAAVVVLTIFCLSCFYVIYTISSFVLKNRSRHSSEEELIKTCDGEDDSQHSLKTENMKCCSLRTFASYTVIIIFNVVVYSMINSGYIYLLLSASLDSSMKLLVNFAMAIVKICWNLFVVPTSIEFTAKLLGDDYHRLKWMIAILLLYNNVAAPSLATAFTDDKCYEQVIAPNGEIDAFYELPVCNVYELDITTNVRSCFEYLKLTIATPFNAPFIYNYQCSSSIIVNYVPVFLFAYGFLALMFPLVYCILLLPTFYISLPQMLKDAVPALLVPPGILHAIPQSPHVPVIRADRIIATLMSHFAVLLTFGIASPILGCVIGMTVCLLTFMHQLIIGRYLSYHSTSDVAEYNVTFNGDIDGKIYSGGLESACTEFLPGLRTCIWTIVIGSNLLFSFILFDFVGDKRGFTAAIWTSLSAIFVIPVLIFAMNKFVIHEKLKSRIISSDRKDGISDDYKPLLWEA